MVFTHHEKPPWTCKLHCDAFAFIRLITRLNGQVMHHTTTASMIFSIPVLIEYISTFASLQAGDVIVTGTPGGVGAKRTPPVWMKPNDTVEIEVGTLVNSIAPDATRY